LTLTPIERQYFGRTVKIPGDLVFADLTTTIINTEKYNVRNEIEKWMEFINNTTSNESEAAADFGTGTAKLKHFQKDGTETMIYQFNDCWPTTISEIALSYDTASDIEQFDVTWAYNYYTMVLGSGSSVATNNVQA
jgi:phosphoenolpyruvate synthase/pyruvate phosphate dikinase